MIKVTTDISRKLVIAHMSGFLSEVEVQEFARDERAAIESMGLRSGEYFLLVNTAATVIQSQDVVAAFQRLVADSPLQARRIAIVRQGSLTRMQTERVLKQRSGAAVFEQLAEAEAWLFAPDDD